LDLISSKCYLNSTNFYFIIGVKCIYIERYLGGGAEFQNDINHITVDIALILPPLPPPHHHNSPATTRNHPAMSPSPPLRDMGSAINTPGCTKWTTAAPAPPLSKGMWAATYLIDGVIGEGKPKGGPNKWEAHPVCRENGLQYLL